MWPKILYDVSEYTALKERMLLPERQARKALASLRKDLGWKVFLDDLPRLHHVLGPIYTDGRKKVPGDPPQVPLRPRYLHLRTPVTEGNMHDLPDKAAKYLESLYEEATAAGRAFRRMGLPRWEARLRAWAEAEWWGGFASAYARAAVAAYEGSDPRAAFLKGLETKAARRELQRLIRELGG